MNTSSTAEWTASAERLLRLTRGPDGIIELTAWLGFEAHGERIPSGAFAAYGLEPESAVRALVRVGTRGTFVAFLVELEGDASAATTTRLANRLRAHAPVRNYLIWFAEAGYKRLVVASFGLDGRLRRLALEPRRPHPAHLETLCELRAREGEGGTALALRHAGALDRTRVTGGFFRDLKGLRARVAEQWRGLPDTCEAERDQLALLLLCRLMFLYFLQRDGHLAGERRYLPDRLREWQRGDGRIHGAGANPPETFYRTALVPLFFGALNRRPDARSPAARALGPLPYLNGGLFERHTLEQRFLKLDLPDGVVNELFDGLLERYRFTTREPADGDQADDSGIDPEMLGRVFEELMAPHRRGSTGTFFTPSTVVDRLIREALTVHLGDGLGIGRGRASALVEHGRARGLTPSERGRLARAVSRLRILDPACGSGAFLLGALGRIARVRAALEPGVHPGMLRREIVGSSLFGVDLQDDAALLCALRLWLSLTHTAGPEPPPPLPNLDRRVRQGDALVDPLDLGAGPAGPTAWHAARTDSGVRRRLRALEPLARRYLDAGPEDKPALRRSLNQAENALAREWLDAVALRLQTHQRELAASAASRDLFGERTAAARAAESALPAIQRRQSELRRLRKALREENALPFFSFRIHFAKPADRGFDLVLSNPPWVRAHRWPAAVRETARNSYAVCRAAGWRPPGTGAGSVRASGGQVDLSLLFLERSLRLLARGGTLAMLLPAKAIRSLYGAASRRMLLRETEVAVVEDHSLNPRGIFRADAFPMVVVATKNRFTAESAEGAEPRSTPPENERARPPSDIRQESSHASLRASRSLRLTTGSTERNGSADLPHLTRTRTSAMPVRVTMTHRQGESLHFDVPADKLPVLPDEPASPWLLAPRAVLAAFRRMQAAGPPLGAHAEMRVRRGVVTGANDIFVIEHAEPKLNNLARVRARGDRVARKAGRSASEARRFRALIEGESLCPLVRGSGISAWRFDAPDWLLWLHDDQDAEAVSAPPRTRKYLNRHADSLRARSCWRPGLPLGAVAHATADTVGAKVLWHDLADTLKAVAVPARIPGIHRREKPLIPLNTVYFVPLQSYDHVLPLAALLNSTPVRAFARALAQRAKDLRFRFLAWTVRLIPLPANWNSGAEAERLFKISRRAHDRGALAPDERGDLDTAVASLYGLDPEQRRAIQRFDTWLRGDT